MIFKLAFILRALNSLKTELKILVITFAVLLSLPAVAALALVNAPVQAVSDALAWLNPVSHKVEYRDLDGKLRQLDAETVWPVRGKVTQEFGVPNLPYEAAHSGIDIAAPIGEPVTTMMPGKVTKAGAVSIACGLCVSVDHGHGIVSSYSHLSRVDVKEGKEVKPGDIIGAIGETGWAHGTHLHLSIRIAGLLVNPRTFMVGDPPPLGR